MDYLSVDANGHLVPVMTEHMIQTVISKYQKDMPDYGYGKLSHTISPVYKFFAFLEQEESEKGLLIFYTIIRDIYFNRYTVEDILKYLENTKQTLTLDSLEIFIGSSNFKNSHIEYKRQRVFETFYPYVFKTIIDAYNNDTPSNGAYTNYLRYNIGDADDSLYNDSFTVFPKINPFDVSETKAFRNYRRAHDEYKRLYQEWYDGKDYITEDDETYDIEEYSEIFPVKINYDTTYFLYDGKKKTISPVIDEILQEIFLHGKSEKYFYISRDVVINIINRLVDAIINTIDASNNFNMSMYADLAEQVNTLETLLRSRDLPKNFATSWSDGLENVLNEIVGVCKTVFSSKDNEQMKRDMFDCVGYNFGVDFLLDFDNENTEADENKNYYQQAVLDEYKHKRKIYAYGGYNGYGKPTINSNKNSNEIIQNAPLLYGSTFLDREFTKPYIVGTGKIAIKPGLNYHAQDINNGYLVAGYYDDDKKLYAKKIDYTHKYKEKNDDGTEQEIRQNITCYLPVDDDFFIISPYDRMQLPFANVLNPKTFNETEINYDTNSVIPTLIYVNDTFTQRVNVTDATWFADAIQLETNIFEYGKTYSFINTDSKDANGNTVVDADNKPVVTAINILATDEFGSVTLRNTYDLVASVSRDKQYFHDVGEYYNYEGWCVYQNIRRIIDRFQNINASIGTGFLNIVNNIAGAFSTVGKTIWYWLTYVPNRIKIGYTTDDYIERLLETLRAGLDRYRDGVILYNDIYPEIDLTVGPPEDGSGSEKRKNLYEKIVTEPLKQVFFSIYSEYVYSPGFKISPSVYLAAYTVGYFANAWVFNNYDMSANESILLNNLNNIYGTLSSSFGNIETNFKNIHDALTSLKEKMLNSNKFYGQEGLDLWRFI